MVSKDQSPGRLFIDRVVLFVFAVLTIISALAWNDFVRLYLREHVKDPKILQDHLIYAVIITGILILVIALFAWLFQNIPGI